jgi:hypothetical protein
VLKDIKQTILVEQEPTESSFSPTVDEAETSSVAFEREELQPK